MDGSVQVYAPITKTDDELRMVYGYASTESLDSQGEIVKKDAIVKALEDYMKFANIREMHQPSAVGKTKQANIDKKGLYIAAKVVDDAAWNKVKEGVYNGFSIGGRIKQKIDNEITDLSLSEISLVDRPANPEAVFDVYKAEDLDKRSFSDKQRKTMADSGKALPDGSFPIANEQDLKNAIHAIGRAKNPDAAKKHIISRAKSLGLTNLLPADWSGSTKEKLDEPEVKKCMYNVANLAQVIDQLTQIRDMEAMEAEMEGDNSDIPSKLNDALKGLTAVISEMVVEETSEAVGEEDKNMTMADESDELAKKKKADETPTEPVETPVEPSVEEKPAEAPVETPVIETPAEVPATPVETPVSEPVAPVTETPTEPSVPEVKPEEKPVEPTIQEVVTQEVEAGKMPSEEEIKQLLEANGIEINQKAIEVAKYNLAGLIVANIEKSMEDQKNKDLAELEAKRAMKEAKIVTGKPNEFDRILKLVESIEDELIKTTTSETPVPPASPVSPSSPAETGSEDLPKLQRVVELLRQYNEGQALTPDELDELKNGLQAASMRFGGGHAGDERTTIPEVKTEQTEDLAKITTELELIKAELETLKNTPMPVKVKASFVTVEKADTDNPTEKLSKAEAESDTLSVELKNNPNDQTLLKRAAQLGTEIMRLRREVNG